jgi:hypothetical protein
MVSPMSLPSLGSGKWRWTPGGSIMVAAFPVTTRSLQRVSQMEHEDVLHATNRLKTAICYRNNTYLPLRHRCLRVSHPSEKGK